MRGIGVSFYPTPLPPTLNIDKIMERFKRDLHIWSAFAGSEDLLPLANPKIYISSKWKPCAWEISLTLKRRIRKFCNVLEPKFRFRPIRHNLFPHKRRTIGFLKEEPQIYGVSNRQRPLPGSYRAKGILPICEKRQSRRHLDISTSDPSICSILCHIGEKTSGEIY